MHIAVEGVDGTGKTTIAKKIVEVISDKFMRSFIFVDKPLKEIVGLDNYASFSNRVNCVDNSLFKMLIYTSGSILLKDMYKTNDIITDRYLISNYINNYSCKAISYMDLIVDELIKPELTIVLYARPDVRQKRIYDRNPMDEDFDKVNIHETYYKHMDEFLERFHFNYITIDTSDLTVDEAVKIIIPQISKLFTE